ncbi:hypothetical protein RAS1_35230 [Phycisphaerae bacterium RAS1]|nr:hypothetical protein RAS1_35230 [Phycisphaerae bacterium RAS1]
MTKQLLFKTSAAILTTAIAAAATVTVSLESPQDGQTLSPGATVNWTINFSVSTGDNQGLALLSADLVQAGANPDLFDLPVAGAAPAPMAEFARPLGISNPGTGYSGTQVGTAGERNLAQIGGSQNTFGYALGASIGTDINVSSLIGHSGVVTLASGSFTAPAAAGTYTYSLANIRANTLVLVNPAPQFSVVEEATVDSTNGSITFDIPAGIVGDSNCDGDVNVLDINFFVAAITGESAWIALHGGSPACDYLVSNDIDGDQMVTVLDINPFVALLAGG